MKACVRMLSNTITPVFAKICNNISTLSTTNMQSTNIANKPNHWCCDASKNINLTSKISNKWQQIEKFYAMFNSCRKRKRNHYDAGNIINIVHYIVYKFLFQRLMVFKRFLTLFIILLCCHKFALPSSALNVNQTNVNGFLDKSETSFVNTLYGGDAAISRRGISHAYKPGLTTIATPLLTTLRYLEKSPHQQQINYHHRNYELDLERDHALPTSAPNADILKSNSNPTYPNPNRHHNHDRERHRIYNSTPQPILKNMLRKNEGQIPTSPMFIPSDIHSYSPPSRALFTPPLPPEYQNPFADKPTLRGSNSDGVVSNSGQYINRRPIPPPSLMPGHERIPFRPPDLVASTIDDNRDTAVEEGIQISLMNQSNRNSAETDQANTLNTPSRPELNAINNTGSSIQGDGGNTLQNTEQQQKSTHKEVLPSIRRILSGSNGKKSDIPEVLLKQVTSRPLSTYHQPPSSPVVLVDSYAGQNESVDANGIYLGTTNSNINQMKKSNTSFYESTKMNATIAATDNDLKLDTNVAIKVPDQSFGLAGYENAQVNGDSTRRTTMPVVSGEETYSILTSTSSTMKNAPKDENSITSPSLSSSSSKSKNDISLQSTLGAATIVASWTIAWNIHVYLSVVLFTILAVYSLYKMLFYNKLTHLFSQSYFFCIHIFLVVICTARIFYLCVDAYNIHGSFHILISELLLNLPATFLTVSFSVLILFLFLKSINHKNNRYSALVRPLTVIVGCGVHIVLCITLHYVESYTLQNQTYYHQQQHFNNRRQQYQYQYQFPENQHQQQQQQHHYTASNVNANNGGYMQSSITPPPPRVLSLICQIIYIFICLSLGLLYLYIYRILKRILRSKSQNYIHGYQNLSYAIHITIAIALLFVLLAALQIFGAIGISTTRLIIKPITAEVDWLQLGYQFSLRLVEIAIIILISWVAGLKTNNSSNINMSNNGEPRIGDNGRNEIVFGLNTGNSRDKHNHHHTNVTGFLFPCTSSSNQEQFESDYPAVCNANTNLHTYTMRTGKLIYDDSFALNSLVNQLPQQQPQKLNGNKREFQLQQRNYQRPFDTLGAQHTNVDYGTQNYHTDSHQYTDYLTDNSNTDHYENPNFDLHRNGNETIGGSKGKFKKTSTASSSVSSSSQQQILLLQNENCYSEPMQQQNCISSSNYDFTNFERPQFSGVSSKANVHNNNQQNKMWPNDKRDRNQTNLSFDRFNYENGNKLNKSMQSNPTNVSNNPGRFASLNSYERVQHGGVHKSGTMNHLNYGGGNVIVGNSSSYTNYASDTNPEMHSVRRNPSSMRKMKNHAIEIASNGSCYQEISANNTQNTLQHQHQQQQQQQQQQLYHVNSDEDIMFSGSNVEHTNLIKNEASSCITNSSNSNSNSNLTDQGIGSANSVRFLNKKSPLLIHNGIQSHQKHIQAQQQQQQPQQHCQLNNNSSGLDSVSAASSNSCTSTSTNNSDDINIVAPTNDSMLIADHGFVRFRALDDINNAQGVGIHNASIRNSNKNIPSEEP